MVFLCENLTIQVWDCTKHNPHSPQTGHEPQDTSYPTIFCCEHNLKMQKSLRTVSPTSFLKGQ